MDISSIEPIVARALELQIGKARVAIDLDQVDRVVETTCTPMPLAHRLVRGIGFDDKRPIVCVVLNGKTVRDAQQLVTAVLLAGPGSVTWAVCADHVLGVVPLVGRSTVVDERLPRWLSRMFSQDGRSLAHVDAAKMVVDIGGAA